MYQTIRFFLKADKKLTDLFFENPFTLIMMEHFNLDFVSKDMTVGEFCNSNNINPELFITIANLYNGFHKIDIGKFNLIDIQVLINYLRNSHNYYKNEKFTEIKNLIDRILQLNKSDEIRLIDIFFNKYYEEVIEHLDYEDQVAFDYINNLIMNQEEQKLNSEFSVKVYKDHHTDIEYKLIELNNLLIKHIPIENDRVERRKLLKELFELDFDLKIHSIIEDEILIPMIKIVEQDLQK